MLIIHIAFISAFKKRDKHFDSLNSTRSTWIISEALFLWILYNVKSLTQSRQLIHDNWVDAAQVKMQIHSNCLNLLNKPSVSQRQVYSLQSDRVCLMIVLPETAEAWCPIPRAEDESEGDPSSYSSSRREYILVSLLAARDAGWQNTTFWSWPQTPPVCPSYMHMLHQGGTLFSQSFYIFRHLAWIQHLSIWQLLRPENVAGIQNVYKAFSELVPNCIQHMLGEEIEPWFSELSGRWAIPRTYCTGEKGAEKTSARLCAQNLENRKSKQT